MEYLSDAVLSLETSLDEEIVVRVLIRNICYCLSYVSVISTFGFLLANWPGVQNQEQSNGISYDLLSPVYTFILSPSSTTKYFLPALFPVF